MAKENRVNQGAYNRLRWRRKTKLRVACRCFLLGDGFGWDLELSGEEIKTHELQIAFITVVQIVIFRCFNPLLLSLP